MGPRGRASYIGLGMEQSGHRFRYRSPALHGPWRRTRQEAEADAIRAGQAHREPERPERIVWRDDARIEEKAG